MTDPARLIRLTFVDEDVAAEAVLLSPRAPVTCRRLWRQLREPLVLRAAHAMWTGPEISMQIPPDVAGAGLREIPRENQTVFPVQGALLWAYLPENAWPGNPDPLFDIGLFYGPQGRVFLPIGWVPCNHFAQLTGDWSGFHKTCSETRTRGIKTLRITRVS